MFKLTFQSLLLGVGLFGQFFLLYFFDVRENIPLICVEEAEFFVPNLPTPIIIHYVEHLLKVGDGQLNTVELTTLHEFLQTQLTIKVDVEGPESLPVVGELLLDARVDPLQNSLQMHLLFDCVLAVDAVIVERIVGLVVEDRLPYTLRIVSLIHSKYRTFTVDVLQ